MGDLAPTKTGLTTRLIGINSAGVETSNVNASGGAMWVTLTDLSGNSLLGQQLMAESIPMVISSNQTPIPVSGAVTTAAPTYTSGTNAQLSLKTTGDLRVDSATADAYLAQIVQNTTDSLLATGSLTSLTSSVTLTLQGTASVNVDVSGSGFVGTIVVYESTPSSQRNLGVFALNSSAIAMNITANGNYRVVGLPTSGTITVAFSAYTSGSATVNIYGSTAPYIVQPYSANAANVLVTSWINDGSGNSITSTAVGTHQGLDVNIPNCIGTPGSAAPALAVMVSGTDGTNARVIKTDTSGNTVTVGAGVAGTPAGGVVSSQGVSGGFPMPENLTQVGGAAITLGQKASAASVPVVLASDQSTVPVSSKVPHTFSAPATASVGLTSTLIVAANAARVGLYLSNTTAQQISLGFNGNAAAYQYGITLFPGEKFWMDEYSFSTGAVYAITSGSAAYIGVQEITT